MSAEAILDEIGDQQGWDDQSKLALCLQYIGNQQDDAAFEDFIREQAREENLQTADEAANPAAENAGDRNSEGNGYENEIEVCTYRVNYRYDLEELELTDELQGRLDAEAEKRAKACIIIDGTTSGELNCVVDDRELRGWWRIIRD